MASVKAGLRAARDALKAGDNEEAARRCEEVLRLDPTSYDALTYQGKAEFLLGQYGKSEGAYVRATKLNPSQLAAWQGLAEVYDQSGAHEQAVPVFKKLVELVPAGDGDGKRRVSFQKRLAAALQKSGCEEEAQQILLALLDAGLEPDAHIEILCLLADLQMMKDEQDLDKRIAERLQSPECMSGAIVCTREAVRIRVVGEWAEEALRQVDNPLNSTLKEIVARTAPNPEYIKYHIAYLLRFTKAIDFAEPRSIQRYNVRLQALERCYKLILGKGGGVPGGCCSPIPYETALRLLEISEEILGGQVAIGGQDFGKSFRRPSGPMGMFKSASHDQLSSLQGRFEGPRQLRRSSSLSSDDGQRPRYRIKLTSGIPKFNTAEHSRPSAAGSDHASSPALEIPSLSTSSPHKHGATDGLHPHALSSIDERTASKVGVNDPMPLSPVSRTPHAFAARKSEKDIGNYVLPQYMRSNSLQMVRKLHRLGSGILNGAEDVIGGNTPLLVEVSEKVACRFAHSFPWNSEAMLQMVLAWRRKTAASSPEEDTFSRARTTNLSELPIAHISPPSQSLKELIKVLQYGILSGSRSAAARIALMQVLLEEEQFQDAADLGQQSTKWMAQRLQDGGFPMVQAGLALQLLTGQALLKCREYDKAGAIFVGLVNGVSEGEVSFGVMAGAPPLSIRQQAQRGLAHIALAQGDRMLARQRYEEVLGASIMGKAPVEHWAAAEYGWMLFEEGDTVRAKMNLEKAVEIATKTDSTGLAAAIAEYNHKLGQIYWSLGKKWKNDRKFAYSRLLAAARVKGSHQADAFALLGHYYYEVAEDTTRARKCYQKAVSLDASQADAGTSLFAILESAKTPPEKLQSFCEEFTNQDPRVVWPWQCLWRVHSMTGQHQKAMAAMHVVLRARPTDAGVWEKLAATYQQMGRATAALKSFDHAAELGGQRLFSITQAASLRSDLGLLTEAVQGFEAALDICRDFAPALLGLGQTYLASARKDFQQGAVCSATMLVEKARSIALQCARQHGNLKSAWKLLGDLEFELQCIAPVKRQSHKAAQYAYAHALHLDPTQAHLWGNVAHACHRQAMFIQEMDSARSEKLLSLSASLLQGGIRLEPRAAGLWEALGYASQDLGVQEYALSRALQLNPKQVTAWVGLGQLYLAIGATGMADKCFENARFHDPENVAVWQGMAALAKLGPTAMKSSLEFFEHAVGLGGSPESILGFAVGGVASSRAHDPAVYLAARKAVEYYPVNGAACNALGLCQEARGSYHSAAHSFRMAQEMEQAKGSDMAVNEDLKLNLARALCKAGDIRDGVLLYDGLEQDGTLMRKPAAMVLYAFALFQAGNCAKARDMLSRVMATDSSAPLLSETVKSLVYLHIAEGNLGQAIRLVEDVIKRLLVQSSQQTDEVSHQVARATLAVVAGCIFHKQPEKLGRAEKCCSDYTDNLGTDQFQVRTDVLLLKTLHLSSLHQPVQALRHIAKAVHLDPRSVMHGLQLANVGLKKSRMYALPSLAFCPYQALSLDGPLLVDGEQAPAGASIFAMIGRASSAVGHLSMQGRTKRAFVQIQQCIHIHPASVVARYVLALLSFQMAVQGGRADGYTVAREHCRTALVLLQGAGTSSTDTSACLGSMVLRLLITQSECALQSNRPEMQAVAADTAQQSLDFALTNGLGVGPCHCQIGRVHWAQNRSKEAEVAFQEAVKDRGLVAALVQLAQLLELEGRHKEASHLLQAAVEAPQTSPPSYVAAPIHPAFAGHPILGRSTISSPHQPPPVSQTTSLGNLSQTIVLGAASLSLARAGDWGAARNLLGPGNSSETLRLLHAYYALGMGEGLGEKAGKKHVKEGWKELSSIDHKQLGAVALLWLSKATRLLGKDASQYKEALQMELRGTLSPSLASALCNELAAVAGDDRWKRKGTHLQPWYLQKWKNTLYEGGERAQQCET